MLEQQKQSEKIKEQRYLTENSRDGRAASTKVLLHEDENPPKSSRISAVPKSIEPEKETVTQVTEVAEDCTQYSAEGSPSSKQEKLKILTQKMTEARKDTQKTPGFPIT